MKTTPIGRRDAFTNTDLHPTATSGVSALAGKKRVTAVAPIGEECRGGVLGSYSVRFDGGGSYVKHVR